MTKDYISVTEVSGEQVSEEQIERLCHRYYWAGTWCADKDVVEAACGTGQGLGYIKGLSNSLEAGDISKPILDIAKQHYKDKIPLNIFSAQDMPFADSSKDVILLFEAIYYLQNVNQFLNECKRILRPGGKVLIVTANKNLYDFNPSPNSNEYYGVMELNKLFSHKGFSCEFFGYFPVDKISLRQRLLRPIKKIVVSLGLIPKTMAGKKLLKRLVFGRLQQMPAEITEEMYPYLPPDSIGSQYPDQKHKVIYCAATLNK
ncbi:MAG: class I SAM-dependent methyltransferase [Candidatus Scalindua rubra]|uniref:Putative methyltransferase n=1 Tax=Candidatus Scalindua brodae TaxID=237368 RepID=A0A0B0ELT7_9BACT|nr:MAG: putative methyltransferase [Candidatus Scalindua brodae]MBZ0108988.1 class I SAM-dependent methyltransferase [Candidatus Scalindua rubra]